MKYAKPFLAAVALLCAAPAQAIVGGGAPSTDGIARSLVTIVGSRGNDWHLLTAGAFITMLLPLIVFFSLQRFFVRGLLAGSVKG